MKNKKILIVIFVSLILITQFIFGLYLARSDSQTTDEGIHISAGYTYLKKNDFRFNPEHPPLVKMLASVPLLFAKLNTPPDAIYFDKAKDFFYDSWPEARSYGEDLLYNLGNNAERLLLLARLPMIILTLILGLVIFFVSSKLWGTNGGILSLLLYVLEPIILANGHLVTTDIGASLGYLLSIYLLWKFLLRPKWSNLILFGLVLGIAELMKFTAIILYPASIILLIYFAISKREKFKKFLKKFGQIIIAFLIAWVVIWAGYSFKIAQVPVGGNSKVPIVATITSNKYFKFFKPVLIPRDYVKGLGLIVGHTRYGHDSFLLGEQSKAGWWYYFPVLFSAKMTISTLVLFLLSIIFIFFDKKNRQKYTFFLLGGLIFLAFAMTSKANIGVRHILPFIVVVMVLCGSTAKILSKKFIGRVVLFLLVAFMIFENVMVFPYFISYYNQLYGGTDNGYKVATDSNYDWGQDIKRIKEYVSRVNLQDYAIEYSWDSDAALKYFGLPIKKYNPSDKSIKYLIINATSVNDPAFKSFQTKPIYARITPSVFIYKLSD